MADKTPSRRDAFRAGYQAGIEKGKQMAYKELAAKFIEQGLIETLQTHDEALKGGKDV